MNAVFASLHKNPFSLSQGRADLLTTEEEEASASSWHLENFSSYHSSKLEKSHSSVHSFCHLWKHMELLQEDFFHFLYPTAFFLHLDTHYLFLCSYLVWMTSKKLLYG